MPIARRATKHALLFLRSQHCVDRAASDVLLHLAQLNGAHFLRRHRYAEWMATIERPLRIFLRASRTAVGEMKNSASRGAIEERPQERGNIRRVGGSRKLVCHRSNLLLRPGPLKDCVDEARTIWTKDPGN